MLDMIPVFNIDVRDTVQLNRNCLTYTFILYWIPLPFFYVNPEKIDFVM